MCNWVLRVAHWALGERDVDTIGVGRMKIWGTEPGAPYVLPFVRGRSQVGARAQRGPNVERGSSLRGPGPWERPGVGGWGWD